VQHLRAEAELLERAGLEVRQQHVGARDDALEDLDALRAAQVDADAPAAAMADREVHR
jgi:hypothetical protein